jgi:hypothetical protein
VTREPERKRQKGAARDHGVQPTKESLIIIMPGKAASVHHFRLAFTGFFPPTTGQPSEFLLLAHRNYVRLYLRKSKI